MNYDQLIKNWHGKASDEDYFSKYVFEYLAFIAFLKKKRFTNTRTDRGAIQKLKRDNIKDEYLTDVSENTAVKESWQKIIDELNRVRLGNVSRNGNNVEEINWWNCSHDHIELKTLEERQKTMGVIHGLDNWENMVEFWYSIRNNLFHGGKDPQDVRDQLLVENGYKTLRPLTEIFIHDSNL